MSLLGYKPSRREVGAVWGGEEEGMTEEAFMQSMLPRLSRVDQGDLIRQTFMTMDSRCRGYLTLSDCVAAFRQIVPHVREAEVERLFWEVDSNGDGCVSFRDFELMMKYHWLLVA